MKRSLLWHSNAPHASTGYGAQTALFLPRLKDHYRLACSAFYGLEGNITPWNGIPVLPGIGSTYGNEVILDHANMWFEDGLRDGLVVTLMDVWVLDPNIWGRMNVASWVPVDHEPVPEPVSGFFKAAGAVPIAMSRFGEEQLRGAELDPLYVPHAVDTEAYRPVDEAREALGISEDAFLVGMVAANKGNPSRKCFVEAFQAFKALHARHDEARLYLHTEITGKFDGVNIPALIQNIGLDPSLVTFSDQYRIMHCPLPPETMAKVYSAFDVLLMPSAGEGFGIPAIEAQACGVPVIGSDFSAQPEVIGAGWLVSGHTHYTPIKSWQFHPDIEDITEALERCYSLPAKAREEAAKRARKHALGYDVEKVLIDHMLPALEECCERFGITTPELVAA